MAAPTDEQVVAVTVLGQDRPGIVAEVTAALAQLGGNLEDSTMTLLRGHFAMIVLVRTAAGAGRVEAALTSLTEGGELVVSARVLPEQARADQGGSAYVLRVHGADRPGIVAAITRAVCDHEANIVDLGTRLAENLYVLVAEVVLPPGADPGVLEADLQRTAARLGVEVHLSPVDDDLL